MEKNKGKNLVLILLFMLLIINIAMIVTIFVFPKKNIEENREFHRSHKFKNMECLIESLNLREDQEAKFSELRDGHRRKIFSLIDSTRNIRHSMLNELLKYDNLDTTILNKFPSKIAEMEKIIQFETISYFLRMREILDKPQYEELVNNFKNVCGCKKKHNKPHHKHTDCTYKKLK